MLAYKKDFGLHQLNVLGLAEAQKMITRGFYTTATISVPIVLVMIIYRQVRYVYGRGPVLTMRLLIWLLSLDV